MLPLLVGGSELSLTLRFLFSRLADVQDQLLRPSIPFTPFENGGGVVGRVCGWECRAEVGAYCAYGSLRFSSMGPRPGDGGQCDEGGPGGG